MTTEDDLTPPRANAGDAVYTAAKAGLAAIPLVGGTAAELVQFLVGSPLESRQTVWMDHIADLLRRLQAERGVTVESLRDNPTFIDAVLKASNLAVRTSSELKRKALQAALAHMALSPAEDSIGREMFLRFIDEFTETHIRILAALGDPGGWAREHGIRLEGMSPAQVLEQCLPELRGKRELYDQLWADLVGRGLVSLTNLHVMMSDVGGSKATPLGLKFLAFIRSPFD